jgi:hypothetical protein
MLSPISERNYEKLISATPLVRLLTIQEVLKHDDNTKNNPSAEAATNSLWSVELGGIPKTRIFINMIYILIDLWLYLSHLVYLVDWNGLGHLLQNTDWQTIHQFLEVMIDVAHLLAKAKELLT